MDTGLVLWFKGPHSFTGEDTAELHVHGSIAVVEGVQDALSKLEYLRPAHPGEFSRRALLNGKMDLLAAEGLADLLDAETQVQRQVAIGQVEGRSAEVWERWRAELIKCLANVEAFIDFGEDDEVGAEAVEESRDRARDLLSEMLAHANQRVGEVVRQGVRAVLVGPPNAGKSSLLNRLASRPAAIVSPIPGTTRDVIEVKLALGGLPVMLSDTAGLRTNPADAVEQEGVARAARAWQAAQVRVLVVEVQRAREQIASAQQLLETEQAQPDTQTASAVEQDEERDHRVGDWGRASEYEGGDTGGAQEAIVVLNKADDRGGVWTSVAVEEAEAAARSWLGEGARVCLLSCATGEGMDGLVSGLQASVGRLSGEAAGRSPLLTRPRHRRHLEECMAALERFLLEGTTADMAAEELRAAVREAGAVTGRVGVEEMLDTLFRDFCIGK